MKKNGFSIEFIFSCLMFMATSGMGANINKDLALSLYKGLTGGKTNVKESIIKENALRFTSHIFYDENVIVEFNNDSDVLIRKLANDNTAFTIMLKQKKITNTYPIDSKSCKKCQECQRICNKNAKELNSIKAKGYAQVQNLMGFVLASNAIAYMMITESYKEIKCSSEDLDCKNKKESLLSGCVDDLTEWFNISIKASMDQINAVGGLSYVCNCSCTVLCQ